MVVKKKLALSGALKDIESEMSSLSRQKASLKKSVESTTLSISEERKKEIFLQQQLAKIAQHETELAQKKKTMQARSDKIADKMSKMSKIKSEMQDL